MTQSCFLQVKEIRSFEISVFRENLRPQIYSQSTQPITMYLEKGYQGKSHLGSKLLLYDYNRQWNVILSRNGLRKLGHSLDILGTFEVPQEVIYYILKTILFWIKKKEYSRKLWEKEKREGERYIRLRDNGASRVRNKQKWKIMSTLTDTRELHLNVTSFKYSQEFYTIISKQQLQQQQ